MGTSGEHPGVVVKGLQFAVGDQVAPDERALPYPPEPFAAGKIRQLARGKPFRSMAPRGSLRICDERARLSGPEGLVANWPEGQPVSPK